MKPLVVMAGYKNKIRNGDPTYDVDNPIALPPS